MRSLAAVERERGLRVDNKVAPGDLVAADADVLEIVVANLADNALGYAPRGGRVVCRLERGEDRWRLLVENDVVDLRPEDLAALTEPFWRKHRAANGRDHAGLGLALTLALVKKSGMELGFELHEGTFRAVLSDFAELPPTAQRPQPARAPAQEPPRARTGN